MAYSRLFHWKFSSVFGVALWFAGVGGMLADKFNAALVFYILGGLWLLGWWLREHPWPHKREGQPQWKESQVKQIKKLCVGALVPIGITALMCVWTNHLSNEHELSLLNGVLIPANDPTPPNECDAGPLPFNELKILLGPIAESANSFPRNVISLRSQTVLILDRDAQGNVAATSDIYDQNGDIVVEIKRNHFRIANDAFEVSRPDRSTLVVVIKRNKEKVLDMRYLNPTAIRIWGTFRLPNQPTPVLIIGEQSVTVNGMPVRWNRVCVSNGQGVGFGFS